CSCLKLLGNFCSGACDLPSCKDGAVDPAQPSPPETPEVTKAAVARASDVRVAVDNLGYGLTMRCGERLGSNLPVDTHPESLLQHPRRTADTMVHRGIEVHDGKRRGQVACPRWIPVSLPINRADRSSIQALEFFHQRLAVRVRQCEAFPSREHRKGDAKIGRSTWVMRIICPAALHR